MEGELRHCDAGRDAGLVHLNTSTSGYNADSSRYSLELVQVRIRNGVNKKKHVSDLVDS